MNTTAQTTTATKPWPLRAVQLDLARQRETLPVIKQFIDDAATWGYTHVHLYLEGLVRTPSFPHRPPDQSYSEQDVQQLVKHAAQRHVELVPCVATLGHAEHFTSCPQLAHLTEKGSTFPPSTMLCPEHPESHAFLEQYITEIAALFPGQHFNIGCDEAWALGTCPRCRASGKSTWDLLVDHITRMHRCLANLGKRTWLWDDMFENAEPATIARLPRDVVLCAWQYDSDQIDLGGLRGHFNGQRRRDWLAIYQTLGFDVLVCPSSESPAGLFALTRYARQHRVLGGLMTQWEAGQRFLPDDQPALALAGRYWSQPQLSDTEALLQQLADMLPHHDQTTRLALATSLEKSVQFTRGQLHPNATRGPLTTNERRTLQSLLVHERLLADAARHNANDIIEAHHIKLRRQILDARLRELFADRADPRLHLPANDADARLQACREEITTLRDLHASLWQKHRPGITPDTASPYFEAMLEQFDDLVALTDPPCSDRAMLLVRLFCVDPFAAPRLSVTLEVSQTQTPLFDGTYKPADVRPGFYDMRLILPWSGSAAQANAQVTFDVTGIGAQGIAYVSLITAETTMSPNAITATVGHVCQPDAVLRDDASSSLLGDPDMLATFRHRQENDLARLIVNLVPQDEAGAI